MPTLHSLQPGELLSRWDDQMLKLISFSSYPREKKKFSASLQKLSLPVSEAFFFISHDDG